MATTPVEPVVEMKIGDSWVDVTPDVRQASADSGGGIEITRGAPSEGNTTEPTSLSFVLNNVHEMYSKDNPASPYYGQIKRNMPVRVGLDRVVDDFARTETNTWGTPSSGADWTITGAAANFDVAGGLGTIAAAATLQHATSGSYADVDMTIKVKISTRTGNPQFGTVFRANLATGEMYEGYVAIGTTDRLVIGKIVNGFESEWSINLFSNLVAGTWYWLRAQTFDQTVRINVWADGDPEPFWQNQISDSESIVVGAGLTPPASGSAGAMTRRGTGVVVSFESIQIDSWRAHAEVAQFPQRFDLSREDRWIPVKAAGVLRRLGQGRSPLLSAITRHLDQYAGTSAGWWTLEGNDDAAELFASRVPDVQPARIAGLTFAADDVLPGVAAVATLGAVGDRFIGSAKKHAATNAWSYVMFCRVPNDPASEVRLATVYSTGTARTWRIKLLPGSVLEVDCLGANGGVLDTHQELFYFDPEQPQGSWIALDLYLQTNGSNVEWSVDYHRPGGEFFYTFLPRLFAGTIGTFGWVDIEANAATVAAGGLFVGQVFHLPDLLPFADDNFALAAKAYVGELAGNRWFRLLVESNVGADATDTNNSQPMGPQLPLQLLTLLEQCAEAEDAVVYEARHEFALVFRPRKALYNQRPLSLVVADGHLSAPLDPSDDDQLTRNDVTVSRPGGGFARSTQETGPLNVNAPEDDPGNGVGMYDEQLELNLATDQQLQPMANWRRSRGTQIDPRFPSVHADLTATAYQNDPALAAWAAGINHGDILLLDTTGDPDTQDGISLVSADPLEQFVTGYVETIDQFDWDITWTTVPGGLYRVGVVGKTTRIGSESNYSAADFMSGTDTTLLSNLTGPGWRWVLLADSAISFPFDVMVSGVRLHVTSVTGSTNPQTMTVDPTPVNGVVKLIPSGSQIKLAEPWRIGL